MRTTIDLPDDLFRRAKATAALRGLKLKEFISEVLTEALQPASQPVVREAPKRNRVLPVMIPASGRVIPPLTNAEIFEILEQGDTDRSG